ncbi:MAG TPA: AMP-binding protein, partial [Paludibacter sp.]
MNKTIDSPLLLDTYFEDSAQKYPNSVAFENDKSKMTYSEVDKLSNQLAHFLREKGIAPEEKAVILLPRCGQIYIGMLGVLKAGGAYIPLDAEIPADRVNFIMQDSGAKLIITSDEILERIGSQLENHLIFNIDHQLAELTNFPTEKPQVNNRTSKDLCYIIYTSGTSGMPKGVLLE